MSQKGPITVTVTNGDATVTTTGGDFLTSIAARQWFTVVNSGVSYQIASVTDNNNFELSSVYAQTTNAAASGLIHTGYTNTLNLPLLERGDIETATIFGRFAQTIESLFGAGQPAFSANLSAKASNVTGDATSYTLICDTEHFDLGGNYNTATGIFTAPVDGVYELNALVQLSDIGAGHTQLQINVVTSNRTYVLVFLNIGAVRESSNGWIGGGTVLADMDASDAAYLTVQISGGTKTVDIEPTHTRFMGGIRVYR